LAFVAPAGTELDGLQAHLTTLLDRLSYDLLEVRLSKDLEKWKKVNHSDDYERIKTLMDAGDELRAVCGKAAVAQLGLRQIIEYRNKRNGKRGAAYLFRSLKTPEEVFALRTLFGQTFYVISVFSDKDKRTKKLVERFGLRKTKETDASELASRDETDGLNRNGQNVRDTFPLGDLFVNGDKISTAKAELERFVELIFGNSFKAPTKAEYAMSYALGAAYRSGDLGRQVGAVIQSLNGDILAIGTNEVPVFGGGQYWPGDTGDADPRDSVRDIDWNDKKQKDLVIPDSIEVTSGGTPADKLSFEPFVGVAPWQYMHLFAKSKRKKKDGTVIHWNPSEAKLRYGRKRSFYSTVEKEWSDLVGAAVAGGK
jgi:deoxycytidylate deaminase